MDKSIQDLLAQLIEGQDSLRKELKQEIQQLREEFNLQGQRPEFMHAEVNDPRKPLTSEDVTHLTTLFELAKDRDNSVLTPLEMTYAK